MLYWPARRWTAGPGSARTARSASGREPAVPYHHQEWIVTDQAQMPALIPMFSVRDPRATLEWLEKLGFQTMYTMPMPDGTIVHAHAARGGAHLMLGPECPQSPGIGAPGMSLYIAIEDSVDELCERARAAGIAVSQDLTDQFWGDRTFEVSHPDGYRIMFSNHVREVSHEEMQKAMNDWAAAAAPA
jgi:uncharacterized glyoxalase superfamily protein PhnB